MLFLLVKVSTDREIRHAGDIAPRLFLGLLADRHTVFNGSDLLSRFLTARFAQAAGLHLRVQCRFSLNPTGSWVRRRGTAITCTAGSRLGIADMPRILTQLQAW